MTHATVSNTATNPAGDEPRRRNPWVVGLLIVVCSLLAAMWVYGLWFAPKEATYRVNDAAWRERAEEICDSYEEQRIALADTDAGYIERPTQAQMLARADIVDEATDILERELAEIVALPLPTARDRELVTEYAGFYRTLISDRRNYTAQLREFIVEPYVETKIEGGPVTNVILDFTTVNEIKSSAPPGELGGDS